MTISFDDKSKIQKLVAKELKTITSNHILEIYKVMDKEYGSLEGSGTLIEIENSLYVLTAEHVLEDFLTNTFAIFSDQGRTPFMLSNPVQCMKEPIDLAISRLDRAYLSVSRKKPVLLAKFANSSKDIKGDILFIHGFPGEKSRYHAFLKGVCSESLPYTTTLHESEDYDPNIHFAIEYRGEGAEDELGRAAYVPNPKGCSGSLVWAARIKNGSIWEPNKMEVVGLAHHWDKDMLICTRVEEIRNFLKQAIHKEMAYFSWLSRNCPPNDSLNDWFDVEPRIKRIFNI